MNTPKKYKNNKNNLGWPATLYDKNRVANHPFFQATPRSQSQPMTLESDQSTPRVMRVAKVDSQPHGKSQPKLSFFFFFF
jgi:hypothetical protein